MGFVARLGEPGRGTGGSGGAEREGGFAALRLSGRLAFRFRSAESEMVAT